MTQRNIYLIDSENVHESWIGNIAFNSVMDRIIIFCGPNNSMPYLKLRQLMELYPADKLEFVATKAGNNSMDFYIVAKLTAMLVKAPKTLYHIISNDHGFDPLLSDMQIAGLRVDRMPTQQAGIVESTQIPAAPIPPAKEKKKSADNSALITQIVTDFCSEYKVNADYVCALADICCKRVQYPCKKNISQEFCQKVSKTIGKGSKSANDKAKRFMKNVPILAEALNEIAAIKG